MITPPADLLLTDTRLYFANAVGEVRAAPGYAYLHWNGTPLTSQEVRALYAHLRNLMHHKQLPYLLADHRAMPAFLPADSHWLLEEWLPATMALTAYTCCAVLPTQITSHRFHTESVLIELRRHLAVSLFEDVPPAIQWLRTCN